MTIDPNYYRLVFVNFRLGSIRRKNLDSMCRRVLGDRSEVCRVQRRLHERKIIVVLFSLWQTLPPKSKTKQNIFSNIHGSHNGRQHGLGLELVHEVEANKSSHNSKWRQVARITKQLL